MIKAVIFDMDGLLVDSEPVWQEVEIELFQALGVPVDMSNVTETMGMRADEVVNYWFRRHPWSSQSPHDTSNDLIDRMVEEVSRRKIALPGVMEAFEAVEEAGLPAAIASSSPDRLIQAAIGNLGIESQLSVIQSAEHEPYGKPHPGVYISTAVKLDITPEHCLAVEDSPNGILAAKSAKMQCVAVPAEDMRSHAVYGIVERVLPSLTEFDSELLAQL